MTNISDRNAFMQAFLSITQPHPEDEKARLLKGTVITLEDQSDFQLRPNEVYISAFESAEKRRGSGTSALKAITPLADQFGVTIWTHAVPISNEPEAPSGHHLRDFYGQHGFRRQGGFRAENIMYRDPQRPKGPGE